MTPQDEKVETLAEQARKLNGGKPFPWGTVVAIHRIGVYAIIEAVRDRETFPASSRLGERFFHPYIGGRNLSRSTDSLDGALALCIAWRAEVANCDDGRIRGWNVAANSQSSHFFEQMVGGFVASHESTRAEVSK